MISSLLVYLLFIPGIFSVPYAGPQEQVQATFEHVATSEASTYPDEPSYEHVRIASLKDHSLRVTDPEPSLCDPTVKQHAGFLDVTDGKHLFFWFFESRISPRKAPLTLWLNGGPGGSSAVGMLFELGPCMIANEGKNTTFNPYSWNTYSNMLFLDQPVNVGYSYATDNSTVDNSPVAAEDVYAFLQLFLAKYPEYADAPFHVAAESYGGTYGPHVGAAIHAHNKALAASPAAAAAATRDLKPINLASVILANGHTDPKIQFAAVPEYVCAGPYALLDPDGPECAAWRAKIPTCERLVQTCYDFNTPLTCAPGALYCWREVWARLGETWYDVRRPCEDLKENCYPELNWIETWLNSSSTKKAIGIHSSISYVLINKDVNVAFHASGDSVRNSARLLPDLIQDGVRLLVYAGMADMACNYIGNEAWVEQLDNKFHDEFKRSKSLPWKTVESDTKAGEVRFAGGGGFTAGNVTFVKVYEAGHMVPYDQPEAALDLFTRWIFDFPFHLPGRSATSLADLAQSRL